MAYLTDDVRCRPNLTVMGHAEVDSILFSGHRAIGITLIGGETIAGGKIILSSGNLWQPRYPHALRYWTVLASARAGYSGCR